MRRIKNGDYVRLKSTGQLGRVIHANKFGGVYKVQTKDGVLRVFEDAIVLVGLLRQLWLMLKSIFA